MQATFLSERQRHVMPIHWDATSKGIFPYTYGALAIVIVKGQHQSVSAIPCLERRLNPVSETFWSLAYRSTPPMEYQPVCVEFSTGDEPALDYKILACAGCGPRVLLAETPEPWPDAVDGWVRDVRGERVCVPLAPRLVLESKTSDGPKVAKAYALHRADVVLRMALDGRDHRGNALKLPKVCLEWGDFGKELGIVETESDPRAEISP